MLFRGVLLVCLASLVACATGQPRVADDDDDDVIDAPLVTDGTPVDARIDAPQVIDAPQGIDAPQVIDAPMPIDAPIDGGPVQTITLSQTTSAAIVAANSVGCVDSFAATAENSYYRVFQLATHGVNTTFTANRVDFGIESADSLFGSQDLTVRLYTLTGSFLLPNLTLLGSAPVNVPNTAASLIRQVPIAASPAPPGSTVVAEVFVPDGQLFGDVFFLGSNTSGETAPGYIRAPDCSAPQPSTLLALGVTAPVHYVITVTGTY